MVQAPEFMRGINQKSKIENLKSNDSRFLEQVLTAVFKSHDFDDFLAEFVGNF